MSLKSRIATMEDGAALHVAQHITIDGRGFLVHDNTNKPYEPSKTGSLLHASDATRRLMLGPFGSGKSTACCAEIVLRACAMPPCNDGVRRCRWAIVRNTYGDIETTVLRTWDEWFGSLGQVHTVKVPRFVRTHRFNDGHGIIELELIFLALDSLDAVKRRTKSLEITAVYINELSEIPHEAWDYLNARKGRYPAERQCPHKFWSGIIADSNPFPIDHWLYNKFEVERPPQHELFRQPPALLESDDGLIPNPAAENIKYLPGGYNYYLDMSYGQTKDFIKVYIMGEYGLVKDGKHVYSNYNDDIHSVDTLDLDTECPILLAWDYGVVSPACLLMQFVDDQLLCIKEFTCTYMSPGELYKTSIKPFLGKYANKIPLESVGDPADTYHGREELDELGLIVESAKTNRIEPRISAVSSFLGRLVGGHPTILVSRRGCPKLRQGFQGEYNYKRLRVSGEERYMDVPNKTHPYSDIHDCLQYGALHYHFEQYEPDEEWDKHDYDEEDRNDVTGY